ncbi:PQQ-binding-like beta-propeller repeat protein [Allokutzneria sp. A3M-2-11 16]|uniref:outer membrane protein assembly factor BamB family protein n=1 Tax=Allokutzneria sp. A3M-2-11 16 TaxID=2962043 RepID=UPI0020B7F3B0|nr:PQQ-binding-like beta-propeller repeat protein [Allokutzneria sp. A3M-2-11 16]MCP3802600.1 PQQ-binding-like beta-propeller repeat protein [Allokutzneria sp. A3M-2-11 16]
MSDQMSVVWTVALPEAPGGEIAIAPGGCVVSGGGRLTAFDGEGRELWSVKPGDRPRRAPLATPNGLLVGAEGDEMVVRKADTGKKVKGWPARGVISVSFAPDGDLLYVDSAPALTKASVDGERRWSTPLTARSFYPPVTTGDLVVVPAKDGVRALDGDGKTRWLAPGPGRGVREPVTVLRDGRLLAQFTEEIGTGLYAIDPRDGATERVVSQWTPHQPITALDADPGRFVAQGPTESPLPFTRSHTVMSVDLPGEVRWKQEVPAKPDMVLAAPDGHLFVIGRPEPELSHRRAQREPDFVLCLDPEGRQRWLWTLPETMAYTPAVDADGTLYVGTRGTLLAVRA